MAWISKIASIHNKQRAIWNFQPFRPETEPLQFQLIRCWAESDIKVCWLPLPKFQKRLMDLPSFLHFQKCPFLLIVLCKVPQGITEWIQDPIFLSKIRHSHLPSILYIYQKGQTLNLLWMISEDKTIQCTYDHNEPLCFLFSKL